MGNKYRDILLIVAIITGFVFIVSLSVLYVENAIMRGDVCSCIIPVPIMIIILSSLGIFVGSFTSYYLINKFSKERKAYIQNIDHALDFLDPDERKIVSYLIKEKGRALQSKISRNTKLSRVKISRTIKNLANKGIITKESKGKTNLIELHRNYLVLFNISG